MYLNVLSNGTFKSSTSFYFMWIVETRTLFANIARRWQQRCVIAHDVMKYQEIN